jgi:digalactosyldiacylglycerol synthase
MSTIGPKVIENSYLMAKHKSNLEGFKLDVYESGEDSQEVQSTARRLDLSLNYFQGKGSC